MIVLKKVDLEEATKQMEKVMDMQSNLDREKEVLKDMLVSLNLDYYGTSPSKYYKTIEKDYITDDGYSVQIRDGYISIAKRVKDNLVMKCRFLFNENISEISGISFVYDSGRTLFSASGTSGLLRKYSAVFERMQKILEEETIFNPFAAFKKFYSFLDFYHDGGYK